jgi:hypothetical protein
MALGRANAMADDLLSFAMKEGFQRSLVELAKAHENKTGLWLQTIESEVMATLKGSLAASAGARPNDDPVVAAVQQMEAFFRKFRNSLEEE